MMRELKATCTQCKRVIRLRVNAEVHDRYLFRGGLVQEMFPALTPDEREVVINADPPYQHGFTHHVCAECWPTLMDEPATKDAVAEAFTDWMHNEEDDKRDALLMNEEEEK